MSLISVFILSYRLVLLRRRRRRVLLGARSRRVRAASAIGRRAESW
jgi:hypothetical protein